MGTMVSVQVVGHGSSQRARRERQHAVDRALGWFTHVESVCSRFDAASELRQLSTHIGKRVEVSALLFEAVQFAVAVADASEGAFDPTVGHRMEAAGFDREHRTGATARADVDAPDDVSYRDIELDVDTRTITLHRPLVLDLGAVGKGLAIDMAARELAPFADFAIDAGGDLFLGGHNVGGESWTVGIRHPIDITQVLETLVVTDTAVCTSGMYERPGHILTRPTNEPADALASVTVVAPSAMVADALSTAALALGLSAGATFLESHNAGALFVTAGLECTRTRAWSHV